MVVHADPLLSIFFGDARLSLSRSVLTDPQIHKHIDAHKQFATVKELLKLDGLSFARQCHSTDGMVVSGPVTPAVPGDFLVTKVPRIGLGVYTADCLPIIFYDTYRRVLGIAHAGWGGTVKGVALKTVQALQKQYGTELDHLRIFLGPAAKTCCYEVSSDFEKEIAHFPWKEQVLKARSDKLYFDLALCNRLQLEAYGVKREAFHERYNCCTICDSSYCSYRRDTGDQRQLTVAVLK